MKSRPGIFNVPGRHAISNQASESLRQLLRFLFQNRILDLAHPTIEGCDIRCNCADVNTLCAEDNSVLSLVSRNFNSPVNDLVEASFVNSLTIE